MSVARRGLYLEYTVVNREDGHVERAATKIKNQHILRAGRLCLVEAIRDRGGRRLVDDAQHVQARDGARVLRGLTLGVIKVGRHRDDRILDLTTEERLSRRLHLLENRRRDLLRQELLLLTLVSNLNGRLLTRALKDAERPVLHVLLHIRIVETATDQALGIKHCVLRVRSRAILGCVTNEALLLRETDVGRGRAVALIVCYDFNAVVLPHADT